MVDTILMPYLIFPIFLETIHIHARKFKVTTKQTGTTTSHFRSFLLAVPALILFILSCIALVSFVWGKYGMALVYSSIIIFWISYNIVALLYALFFMLGRHTYRSSDRIEAEESVIVHGNKSDYKAQTVNISDSGLALYITDPFYIEDNQQVSLTVSTKRYKASLVGSLVYVRQDGKGWRYAFSVKPKDNQSKRQYLQIVHDQPHSLPEQMNLWDTAYDDMVRNIQKRLAKQHYQRRRYPRLSINHILKFTDGTTCTLIDFNYRYLAVKDLKIRASLNYTYLTKNGVRLDLKVVIHAPARAGRTLLKVENLTSLEKNGFLDEVTQDLCGGR